MAEKWTSGPHHILLKMPSIKYTSFHRPINMGHLIHTNDVSNSVICMSYTLICEDQGLALKDNTPPKCQMPFICPLKTIKTKYSQAVTRWDSPRPIETLDNRQYQAQVWLILSDDYITCVWNVAFAVVQSDTASFSGGVSVCARARVCVCVLEKKCFSIMTAN